jgi:hypothetical protein
MPGRRLFATLLFVATASCSDAFQAAPGGDAEAMGDMDASSDPAMPDVGMPPEDGAAAVEASDSDAAPVPPVAKDLLLWLRADVGVTETRGSVPRWPDLSGHHSDGVQTDETKQPRLRSSGPSGRPAVVFDDDDFMSLPAGFGDFSLGISMFAVYYTDTMLPCVDVLDLSNGPEVDDITLGRHDGHVHYEVSSFAMPGDDFPLGMPVLASVVHQTDGTVQLRLNGAPFSVGTSELPASVTRLSNVVGRSLYADCGSLAGGLSEALVYGRALGNDERALVETYLQSRWGCCK